MKEKFLSVLQIFSAVFCILIGIFFLIFTVINAPVVTLYGETFTSKLFLFLESNLHALSFYIICILLAILSLTNHLESGGRHSFLFKLVLFFAAVGTVGVILNAVFDIFGISEIYSHFGMQAVISGYVTRFDLILCLVVFIICGLFAYRIPKGVYPKNSEFLILYICIALWNAATVIFGAVFDSGNTNALTYIVCLLSLICRPVCAMYAYKKSE